MYSVLDIYLHTLIQSMANSAVWECMRYALMAMTLGNIVNPSRKQ